MHSHNPQSHVKGILQQNGSHSANSLRYNKHAHLFRVNDMLCWFDNLV